MEGVAVSSYRGLRGYFRRREYQRLDGSGRRRRRTKVEMATMGYSNRRRTGFFIRFKPKLKLKLRFFKRLSSPKKFFVRLKDAYVKMMLSFANSTVFASGLGAADGGGGAAGLGCSFGRTPLKEYDEKMILEIYTSLMVQTKLNNNTTSTNLQPLIRNRLATVPEISTEQRWSKTSFSQLIIGFLVCHVRRPRWRLLPNVIMRHGDLSHIRRPRRRILPNRIATHGGGFDEIDIYILM